MKSSILEDKFALLQERSPYVTNCTWLLIPDREKKEKMELTVEDDHFFGRQRSKKRSTDVGSFEQVRDLDVQELLDERNPYLDALRP